MLSDSSSILPPGRVLYEQYLSNPTNDLKHWARECNVTTTHLLNVFEGYDLIKDYLATPLATLTNKPALWWLSLQNQYLLHVYPKLSNYSFENPDKDIEFLKIYRRRESCINVHSSIIYSLLEKHLEINPLILNQSIRTSIKSLSLQDLYKVKRGANFYEQSSISLGIHTGMPFHHWLNEARVQQFEEFLLQKGSSDFEVKSLTEDRSVFMDAIDSNTNDPIGPGVYLEDRYLKHLNIPIRFWICFFQELTPKLTISGMAKYPVNMPFWLVDMICKLFDTKPFAWIDLQNRFNCLKKYRLLVQRKDPKVTRLTKDWNMENPVALELYKQIHQLDNSYQMTCQQIDVSPWQLFQILFHGRRIDIELSLKLSKAFKTEPILWLDAQAQKDLLDFQIEQSEQRKTNTDLSRQLEIL